MLEINKRYLRSHGDTPAFPQGQLQLPFDVRQKSRFRARLVSGDEVALMLKPGEVLRGGELLQAADGRVIEVIAQPEAVLHVECKTPAELARMAYHLGNRHIPVQVGDGFLRIAVDHVIAGMLRGLGVNVNDLLAPFEPESGAYFTGHHHEHEEGHLAQIHEYHQHEHDE